MGKVELQKTKAMKQGLEIVFRKVQQENRKRIVRQQRYTGTNALPVLEAIYTTPPQKIAEEVRHKVLIIGIWGF